MKNLILVGLGGFLGSVGRYSISLLFLKYMAERSYFGTLTVNLLGSLLIGALVGYFVKSNASASIFWIAGFCGGFTTFSTFSLDGIRLLKNGLYGDFTIYALLSASGGLALCALGFVIVNKL